MGLYFSHPASLLHDTGAHPECADRIRAIEAALDAEDWRGLTRVESQPASREQIERAHTASHFEQIERLCAAGGGPIDGDTLTVAESFDAATRAAGGACEAAARLLAGEASYAFSGSRPPGHHAESDRAMGFCLFNSAAIAALDAIASGPAERVLILDWDVHHGNGTAEILEGRDDVLYFSIHQSPLYPGTGAPREHGTGVGTGYNINLPVPPGANGEVFLSLIQHLIVPVAREFRPDLLLVSAGYDAHADDPLANCELTDADYASMSAVMRDLGAELGVPVLVCLEGGYDLDALGRSVVQTLRALGDDSLAAEQADAAISAPARKHFAPLWPLLTD